MNLHKMSIVLLALLLAAMAMVPMVSAGKILSSKEILGMEYLKDTQSLTDNTVGIDRSSVSEYAFVTVDSKGFMKAADTDHKIAFSGRTISYNWKKSLCLLIKMRNFLSDRRKVYLLKIFHR